MKKEEANGNLKNPVEQQTEGCLKHRQGNCLKKQHTKKITQSTREQTRSARKKKIKFLRKENDTQNRKRTDTLKWRTFEKREMEERERRLGEK